MRHRPARASAQRERTEAPRAARRRDPGADRLLALQRSAGNRAVGALLARDAKTKPKPPAKAEVTGPRVIVPGVGTIPIESFSFGTAGPPRHDEREKPKDPNVNDRVTDAHVSSKVGDHSPALWKAVVDGSGLGDVVIVWPAGEGKVQRLTLKNAMLTNYSTGGQDQEGRPHEQWSLAFDSVNHEIVAGD